MKKRLLSLAVALALCLGLAVPAFASDDDKLAWHISTISATQTAGGRTFEWNAVSVDHPWTEIGMPAEHSGYRAVAKDSVFTVANVCPAEDDGYIEIWASYCTPKEKENDLYFTYEYAGYAGCLTHKIGFSRDIYNIPTEESGGVVRLLSGQSIQFKLPLEYGEDSIYLLELEKHVPGQSTYYRTSYYFKVDDAAMSSYLDREAPSRPGTPAVQPAEADSFPYSIPGTSEFLRFSTSPVAKYQTIVPDFDANDNLYDKEVTVYQFEVGTKLGLTTQGIADGYTISNLSSEDFEGSMHQLGFALDKATTEEQLYMADSPGKPSIYVYIQPVNTNTSFVDVKPGDYFEEAVKWAVRYGITNGTSTTTFSPGQTCTIAEILTFLYRAVGEPGSSISFYFQSLYQRQALRLLL